MKRPKWIQSRLSSHDLESIEKAIGQAETKTSGELVPMIVRRSSTVGHIPLTLLLILINFWFVLDRVLGFYTNTVVLDSPFFIFIGLIIIFLLTRILSPMEWIGRILTPRHDQISQVNQRAEIEFFESNIKKTKNSTGILLMLSVMEHRAVVLADKTISEKLPPETWNEVIEKMISGIEKKNIAQGMVEGIDVCGELLSRHFPLPPDDTNELPNHLIIKD